jgi:hypothetical protein
VGSPAVAVASVVAVVFAFAVAVGRIRNFKCEAKSAPLTAKGAPPTGKGKDNRNGEGKDKQQRRRSDLSC